MGDETLKQDKPTNTGQADYGGAKGEQVSNERAAALSDKDRIDAMDADNFDPVAYQQKGQGGPEKGLAADEEE